MNETVEFCSTASVLSCAVGQANRDWLGSARNEMSSFLNWQCGGGTRSCNTTGTRTSFWDVRFASVFKRETEQLHGVCIFHSSHVSGYCMWHSVWCEVFYCLHTRCVYVFCVDLRTNSDYFTLIIKWVLIIIGRECVYCAVRSTFYVLPTQCVYVFCEDSRTNSDYFTVQLWLVGWYIRDGLCLLRGTDWPYK